MSLSNAEVQLQTFMKVVHFDPFLDEQVGNLMFVLVPFAASAAPIPAPGNMLFFKE